ILLHDCRITERANAMLRVKTSDRKGAYIENITVSNVTVTAEINHLISLITNLDYQWGRYPARERMLTRIDGVKVENVTADSVLSIYALHGDSRLPTRNFTIRNVKAKTLRSENFSENVELDFVR
ncbi:MAG: hypothetical protein IKJ45_09025, partial [Kiritimatiellae bacterium]|nr:hypothetical protein [Kiritimatiellia bacterium]